MNLRAHHTLCVHGFRGYGYSPEFIKNMEKVVKELKANPHLIIEFVEGPDEICAACPYNLRGGCRKEGEESEEIVRERDEKVENLLGVRSGAKLSMTLIQALLREKLEPQIIEDLCQNCQWFPLGYCQEGLDQLKQEAPEI